VGILTFAPGAPWALDVAASVQAQGGYWSKDSTGNSNTIMTTTGGASVFQSYDRGSTFMDFVFQTVNNSAGTAERMRIVGSNGRVGIGTATPSHLLALSTDSAYKPTSTLWSNTSDQRVKINIEDANMQICYDIVKRLPLRRFQYSPDFIEKYKVRDRRVVGWIAQEVESVFPNAVDIIPYDSTLDLSDAYVLDSDQIYKTMYGALTKVIADKEVLETTVAALEADKEVLETKVAALEADKEVLETKVAALEADKEVLETKVAALEADKQTLEASFAALVDRVTALEGNM
jgi:chaperonin cofactor prefoldin